MKCKGTKEGWWVRHGSWRRGSKGKIIGSCACSIAYERLVMIKFTIILHMYTLSCTYTSIDDMKQLLKEIVVRLEAKESS